MALSGIDVWQDSGDDASGPYGTIAVDEWDFDKQLVPGLSSDGFASSTALLVCAAPARLPRRGTSDNGRPGGVGALAGRIQPIALAQDFSLQQNQGMSELPEIGSGHVYNTRGRTSRQASLSRILFNGDSLLRALYRQAGDFKVVEGRKGYEQLPAAKESSLMYVNLESRFFAKPTGLYIRASTEGEANSVDDSNSGALGGWYLEECFVRNYGIQTNANNTIVAENASLTCSRVTPIMEG